jgi:O-antigen/teichoic acid export membrane protein
MISNKELKIGTSYLFAGNIFQAVIGFSANLVLVRFLFPEEFGHFAIIMASATLTFSIVSLRLDAMILRVPDGQLTDGVGSKYFVAAIYETAIATLLLTFALTVYGEPQVWEIGLLIALAGRHWAQQNKGFFERQLPYRKLAVLEAVSSISSHVLTVCLVLVGVGAEVLFIREIYLTIIGVIGIWWIKGLTTYRVRLLSIAEIRSLLREARGIWLDGVLENSFSRIVILMVGEVGGDRSAGYFMQAQKLALIPHQLIAPVFGRVAGNWFARVRDKTDRAHGRDRVLIILAVFLIGPAVICLTAADIFVPFLLGDKWMGAVNLLAAMSGMIVFHTLFEMLRNYCIMTQLVRWLLIARCMQYIGGAIPVVLFALGWIPGDVALAFGLGSAYALAFTTLLFIIKKTGN